MAFLNALRDRSSDLLTDGTDNPTTRSTNGLTTAIDSAVGLNAASSTPTVAAPVAAVSDWFSQTFKTAGLANYVRQAYTQDNGLDRFDVIGFFDTIANAGSVTSTEFQDCQTLIQDASALKMPQYVTVLASKVVQPNMANNLFQGSYLGNLQVGSTANQLDLLVDKWFYGSDHPYAVIPAMNDHAERDITYQWASGSLFGTKNYPDMTDVQQNQLGDCYFLTALATTAAHNPNVIRNMFIDNGDGTFTVRLFAEQNGVVGSPDYVTVDRALPTSVTENGQTGSFAYYDSGLVGLWVALAEKAYAQLSEEQVSQRPVASNGYTYNSYSSIEGGFSYEALPAITGRSAGYFSNTTPTAGKWGSFPTITQIAQWIAGGWLPTVGTDGESDRQVDSSTGIVFDHAYTIYSADPSTGQLLLYNPWGDNQSNTGDYDGFKQISYSDLIRDADEVDVG